MWVDFSSLKVKNRIICEKILGVSCMSVFKILVDFMFILVDCICVFNSQRDFLSKNLTMLLTPKTGREKVLRI